MGFFPVMCVVDRMWCYCVHVCVCVHASAFACVCVCLSLQFISSHVGKLKLFAVLYTATASVKFVHFAYHWRFDKLQLQKQQQQPQTTLMLHCRRCHLFDISSNRHNQPSKRVQKMFDLIYWKCQGNFMSMVNYDWVIVPFRFFWCCWCCMLFRVTANKTNSNQSAALFEASATMTTHDSHTHARTPNTQRCRHL